jgi:hypothetical protein
MFDPRNNTDAKAEIISDASACERCIDFVYHHMPGTDFDELMVEKAEDEALAEELLEGATKSSTANALDSCPSLDAKSSVQMGYCVSEKRYVLTYAQILVEYERKTPKSLSLQPILVPAVPRARVCYQVKRSESNKHFKDKYPTLTIFAQSVDFVDHARLLNGGKRLFEQHPQHMLRSLTADTSHSETTEDGSVAEAKTRLHVFSHASGHDEILERARKIDEKYGKLKRAKTALEVAEDSADGDTDREDDLADHMPGVNTPRVVDVEGTEELQRQIMDSPIFQPSPSPTMSRGNSLQDLGSDVTPKSSRTRPQDDPNPHVVGTVDYWVYELKFEFGFDEIKNGRAVSQSKILLPKLDTDDRDTLQLRLDLFDTATKLGYRMVPLLSDAKIIEYWTPLHKAKAKPTLKLRIALFERSMSSKWDHLDSLATIPEKHVIFDKICCKAYLWSIPGEQVANFNMIDPTLPTVLGNGKVQAKLFVHSVFPKQFLKHIKEGETGLDHVKMFNGAIEKHMNLPEDAEIADDNANLLLQTLASVKCVNLIAADSITPSTDLSCLKTIDVFEEEAMKTETQTANPLQVLGRAMRASPWWSGKVSTLTKYSKELAEHGPVLQKKYSELLNLKVEATTENAAFFCGLVEDIVYMEVVFVEFDICRDIRKDLLRIVSDLVVKELAVQPTDSSEGSDFRTLMYSSFQGVLKSLSKLYPHSPELQALAKRMQQSVGKLDGVVKQSMLLDALAQWSTTTDEPTFKLKDALQACKGIESTTDINDKMTELWDKVFNGVVGRDGTFLEVCSQNEISTLEVLSNRIAGQEGSRRAVVTGAVAAASRMVVLHNSTKSACNSDEKPLNLQEKETLCMELLRAKQNTAEQVSKCKNMEIAKQHDATNKMNTVIEDASHSLVAIATTVRLQSVESCKEHSTALIKAIDENPNYKSWKAVFEEKDNIQDLKTEFQATFTQAPTEEWKDKANNISYLLRQVVNKTSTFDLVRDAETEGLAEKAISQARHAHCIYDAMSCLTDPTVSKDQIQLRRRMRLVQTEFKTYHIKPDQIGNSAFLEAYKKSLSFS